MTSPAHRIISPNGPNSFRATIVPESPLSNRPARPCCVGGPSAIHPWRKPWRPEARWELARTALDGNLELLSFISQRQTSLSPNFKTRGYGFTNVDKSLIPSLPLADAAWNKRAFGYPKPSSSRSIVIKNLISTNYSSIPLLWSSSCFLKVCHFRAPTKWKSRLRSPLPL